MIWPDYLRAVATISVILVHASDPILFQYGNEFNRLWWIADIYSSIVRFCVPAFFNANRSTFTA
ncbi:MAG: hypothetical protein HC906_15925 [Bacteroidales bacterium]|nr:hypothetical protein [Bacteroidales bacterium]